MVLAQPCFPVFTEYCGLNSVFGGHLTNRLWPLESKRTILLSSDHNILRHFSLGQSMCSLANCNLFSTFFFLTMGLCGRLLADSLASHRRLLMVTVLTGNFTPSFITLELINCHFGYSSIHSNGSFLFSFTFFWFWLPF